MTRRTHPPQLLLDNQLCFALYRASRAVVRGYTPFLDELGLTYPQYLAMLVLWESEPMAVGEVGERLHLDSGTLTPLFKRLEESGLVERHRDPEDERRVLVGLTPEGRALREHAADVPARIFSCYGLPLDDAGALRDRLVALADAVEAVAPTA